MRNEIDWVAKRDALRETAQALLLEPGKIFPGKHPTEILLNELILHKVELEMQIDELRRSTLAMEESRDRYLELYDQSPVGFITVDKDGTIRELNLTASWMLAITRPLTPSIRFTDYIDEAYLELFNHQFLEIMQHSNHALYAILIKVHRANTESFNVKLFFQKVERADAEPLVRLTVVELSH
jgi:PAS domain-containing protein